MKPKGMILIYPKLEIKQTIFATRYNHRKAHMSNNPLGLQALIYFLGTYCWINIKKDWLI